METWQNLIKTLGLGDANGRLLTKDKIQLFTKANSVELQCVGEIVCLLLLSSCVTRAIQVSVAYRVEPSALIVLLRRIEELSEHSTQIWTSAYDALPLDDDDNRDQTVSNNCVCVYDECCFLNYDCCFVFFF
jgi:hypothetical protein